MLSTPTPRPACPPCTSEQAVEGLRAEHATALSELNSQLEAERQRCHELTARLEAVQIAEASARPVEAPNAAERIPSASAMMEVA